MPILNKDKIFAPNVISLAGPMAMRIGIKFHSMPESQIGPENRCDRGRGEGGMFHLVLNSSV